MRICEDTIKELIFITILLSFLSSTLQLHLPFSSPFSPHLQWISIRVDATAFFCDISFTVLDSQVGGCFSPFTHTRFISALGIDLKEISSYLFEFSHRWKEALETD